MQRIGQASRPQQRQVQRRPPQRRQGYDARRCWFDHALQVHHRGKYDPRLDLRHTIYGGDFGQQATRRAGRTCKDIGKAVTFVKGVARFGQRPLRAGGQHHDHHAASQHHRDGKALGPDPPQITQHLAIQRAHHQLTLDGAMGALFSSTLVMRPSAM